MRAATLLITVLSCLSFTSAKGLFEPALVKKRNIENRAVVVAANTEVCATVGIDILLIPGTIITPPISLDLGATCICVVANAAGQLSLSGPTGAALNGLLSALGAALGLSINTVIPGTGLSIATTVENLLQASAGVGVCVFLNAFVGLQVGNEGSTANGGACNCAAITCDPASGFPVLCNGGCYVAGTTCPSGVPIPPPTRRSLGEKRGLLCPAGMTACGLPESLQWVGKPFECIDIESDIESCGACAFPLPGEVAGEDCTAIPHSASVSCVSGQCKVNSCTKGFSVQKGTTCVQVDETRDLSANSERGKSRMDRKRSVAKA